VTAILTGCAVVKICVKGLSLLIAERMVKGQCQGLEVGQSSELICVGGNLYLTEDPNFRKL